MIDVDSQRLQSSVQNAVKWSSITEILARIITPVTNMLLARILVPEAFGVVATVTMVFSFADMFSDAGFQKYLVQHAFKDDADKHRCATVAFWTNLAISLFLWGMIAIFSTPIAVMVGAPGLGHVITIACIQLVFTSFSSIQMALYKRDLNFKTLFAVRIAGILIPFAITVPMAFLGFGYWALIVGMIGTQFSNAVILTAKSKWRPRPIYSIFVLKDMLSFSVWSLVEAITIWFTLWVDVFIVGRFFNAHDLGLYKTSLTMVNALMTVITSSIVPVLFTALSRVSDDDEKFSRMYFLMQKLCSVFVFPLGTLVFVFRDFITDILLGGKWAEARDIMGVWALTGMFVVVLSNFPSEAYRSKGKPILSVLAQMLHLVVLIPVCLVSANYGFWPFVYARSIVRLEFVVVNSLIMVFFMKQRMDKMMGNILPPIVSSIAMGAIGLFIYRLSTGAIWAFSCILFCVLVYFASLMFFPSMRKVIKDAILNRSSIMEVYMTASLAKIKKILRNPGTLILKLNQKQMLKWIPDKLFLQMIYRIRVGKKLNLENPRTFNEKLNWLKLHDRNPAYVRLADKYEVRSFVRERIGEKYLVKLLGIYDSFDEIDFSSLPNRFVLKCTHDSGGVVLCPDKSRWSTEEARKIINGHLKRNYYYQWREWQYKDIKPRIIIEEYVETSDGSPPLDYKIFCFNGEPGFLFVASDRGRGTKFDFFSLDWEKYQLTQHYPNSSYVNQKPKNWEDMMRCARILSKGFHHVRVDFYVDAHDKVLFGEMTLAHFSGCEKFVPESYDEMFGDMLTIPYLQKGDLR